jgi:hypothetical protein
MPQVRLLHSGAGTNRDEQFFEDVLAQKSCAALARVVVVHGKQHLRRLLMYPESFSFRALFAQSSRIVIFGYRGKLGVQLKRL